MFLPCSLRACCPSSPPLQGSGRDYCRSPLPCRGARRGNPPGPPREGAGRAQSDQPHSVCPLCTLPAPSLPSGPPGGLPIMCFFSCSSLVLSLLAACALPLLAPLQGSGRDYCRSPLPCRGARRGNPPGPPREGAGRAQSDQPHSVCPLCTLPAPSLPSGPPGGLPFSSLFSIWLIFH